MPKQNSTPAFNPNAPVTLDFSKAQPIGATVPMIAPDGSSGEIPQARVQDALKAGFKQAVAMTAPDGSTGYIPTDRQQDALNAGFKPTVKLDFSKAQPINPPPSAGGSADKCFFGSLLDFSGARSLPTITGLNPGAAISSGIQAVMHPVDTFKQVTQPVVDTYNEAKQAYQDYKSGNNAGAIVHGVTAVPVIGPALNMAAQQAADNGATGKPGSYLQDLGKTITSPGAMGTNLGTAIGLTAPGVVKDARLAEVTNGVTDAAAAAKARAYPTPQSVPAPEMTARNLGKALVVSPQAMPNFVRAATDETGTILGYAAKNGIPINSTLDFAKAAKATADAVQTHYDTQILGPHAGEVVSVPPDYRGVKLNTEGPRATLGDIQKRIDAINQEMSPNYRKSLAQQTNAANVSDADLLAEKRGLNNLLRDKLADMTGLEPEDIAAVQQKAGKLRTIADESNLSANTNTTAAGKAAMGRSDIPTGTKLGMLERGVQALQGGPEIIGNRYVNAALRDIQPADLNLPQPSAAPPPKPQRQPLWKQMQQQDSAPIEGQAVPPVSELDATTFPGTTQKGFAQAQRMGASFDRLPERMKRQILTTK